MVLYVYYGSSKGKQRGTYPSQAQYACQLRKDIIPLMLQRNFKADGWLGMLVRTKQWIDF